MSYSLVDLLQQQQALVVQLQEIPLHDRESVIRALVAIRRKNLLIVELYRAQLETKSANKSNAIFYQVITHICDIATCLNWISSKKNKRKLSYSKIIGLNTKFNPFLSVYNIRGDYSAIDQPSLLQSKHGAASLIPAALQLNEEELSLCTMLGEYLYKTISEHSSVSIKVPSAERTKSPVIHRLTSPSKTKTRLPKAMEQSSLPSNMTSVLELMAETPHDVLARYMEQWKVKLTLQRRYFNLKLRRSRRLLRDVFCAWQLFSWQSTRFSGLQLRYLSKLMHAIWRRWLAHVHK